MEFFCDVSGTLQYPHACQPDWCFRPLRQAPFLDQFCVVLLPSLDDFRLGAFGCMDANACLVCDDVCVEVRTASSAANSAVKGSGAGVTRSACVVQSTDA